MKKTIYQTVILSAPPGWGKTTLHRVLCIEHRCIQAIDDWRPGIPVTPGALHLTNIPEDRINLVDQPNVKLVVRGWA